MSTNAALAGVVAFPKEVANTTLQTHSRKNICRAEKIVDQSNTIVLEHQLPKFVQPLAASEPTRRNYHRQIAGVQILRLLDEEVINWSSACAIASVIQLIRRIADDDVKLHVVSKQLGDPSFDVIRVNEGISVRLATFAAIKSGLARAAELALSF